ncbi:adenine phosphoribosyltransferase [Bifidobacterium subtile]|jgi:adenine phosphoribosyltransferase|uniref:Adenine phosphoribosyltransferase n=1 Tax=Bifidobacterium subtile TaxID=77635 RepID=A0A087E1U7_9BIFI|nr:adenine phosphoribosyltransferase [Bifidobacterium subtile]KFJ01748.1 adenine phosphoribosyltransferase [Bifidobacterium subtile]MCI1223681.1 adenine phosphoribosyltransferase [Bifidobacterium subtile]MCI1241149.1 adenine phosphoribosyltransferase [Bifidobacterium subtile]MCI1258338.1 adenine phosphoribosyltransferase [Bifidobacterium subtile]QOL37224.1 adenine phosphoribosyltransferase [Bifidobacterium subtile]
MTSSDISIDQLECVGSADAEYVLSLIRTIPGFPNKNVLFRDFMPVLADPKGLATLLKALKLALPVAARDFDSVAGLEARGFLFGPALAASLGKGFIALRKTGKLPPETISEQYTLEYGQESVEVETNAISSNERVLIVDDLIATGGSANAAAHLVEKCGGKVAGFSFVMELQGLGGRASLGSYPASALVTMPA